jgi:transcriptional regulator with XRE-family HTH domain
MGNIRLGAVIAARRKEKGVTQEELARHLGVSKPAVSKWESDQSYPDIVLLPLLAAYFGISVDELIGYEPQMNQEEIRRLYHRLADAFAKGPFEQVYQEVLEYQKKYFSCWQLQIQMGLLLLNHIPMAGTPERIAQLTKEVQELFHRVSKSCTDISLARQALQYEAYSYLCMNEEVPAIDILEELKEPMISPESLLIKAYQLKGDNKKAMECLQGHAYVSLINIISCYSDFFQLSADQPERLDIYYHKFIELADLFDINKLQPAALIKTHYVAALIYVMQDRKAEALEALENYLAVVLQMDKGGFFLKGNEYFDVLEDYFADIDVETAAPRNAEVIWKDIKNIVTANPAFAPLESEERYQRIKKRIEREIGD